MTFSPRKVYTCYTDWVLPSLQSDEKRKAVKKSKKCIVELTYFAEPDYLLFSEYLSAPILSKISGVNVDVKQASRMSQIIPKKRRKLDSPKWLTQILILTYIL